MQKRFPGGHALPYVVKGSKGHIADADLIPPEVKLTHDRYRSPTRPLTRAPHPPIRRLSGVLRPVGPDSFWPLRLPASPVVAQKIRRKTHVPSLAG